MLLGSHQFIVLEYIVALAAEVLARHASLHPHIHLIVVMMRVVRMNSREAERGHFFGIAEGCGSCIDVAYAFWRLIAAHIVLISRPREVTKALARIRRIQVLEFLKARSLRHALGFRCILPQTNLLVIL